MTALEAKMAELATRFAARAAQERAALAAELAAGNRGEVQFRAHKLAGLGAMFGHPAVGEAALALEAAAEHGGDMAGPAARLDALLAELESSGA